MRSNRVKELTDQNPFENRDIISIKDFSRSDLDYLFDVTDAVEPIAKSASDLLKGKILANLFFEPSTRTRLSFEAAILRLGGRSIGFAETHGTSVEKGENLADTIRVVENYADILVIRHSLEGSAKMAAEFASIPVINAGSGAEEHPTQAMLDLYTIKREFGRIDGLEIAMVGDLRYGRTVHSLAYALTNYDVKVYLVSPEILKIRREVKERVDKKICLEEHSELKDIIDKVDVVYMTRIQKERFADLAEYEKVKNSYKLSVTELKNAKSGLTVMHPLPRVNEISYDVDATPHAKYFNQVWYGLLLRMALLGLVLGKM